MGILSKILGGGDLVKAVGDSLDNLITSDEERKEIELEQYKAEREYDYKADKLVADQNIAQADVNKTEAASASPFVAGWRPAIGWVGAIALCYQFLIYPVLLWLPLEGEPPPQMEANVLYTIITGMLGIAGMRSFDKLKNSDTKRVGK